MQLMTLTAESIGSVWPDVLALAERMLGEALPESLRRSEFELGPGGAIMTIWSW